MFEPGIKNVDDYHKEMEVMMVHANLVENREATIARWDELRDCEYYGVATLCRVEGYGAYDNKNRKIAQV